MDSLLLRLLVPVLFVCAACRQPDAARTSEPAERPSAPVEHVSSANPANASAPRIVFLGDSLTAGYGLDKEDAVPSLIQKRLQDAGYPYEVVNAGVSGDTNPIHLSDDFAKTMMFEGRIAHGMLSASFISTLIGTRLPGPGAIYMGQSLKFLAPVRPGQTVNTRATVTDINHEKARITLHTQCMVGDDVVIEGEALIKVPVRNGNGAK